MQQKKLLSLCVFYASTFLALNIGIGSFDILWSAGPNWSIGKQKTSLLTDPARQNSQNAPTKQNNLLQQGANALRNGAKTNAQVLSSTQNSNSPQQGTIDAQGSTLTNAQLPSSPAIQGNLPSQGSDALQAPAQSDAQKPLPAQNNLLQQGNNAQVLSSTQNSNSPQQGTIDAQGSTLTNAQLPSSPATQGNVVSNQGSSNGSQSIANPSGSEEPSVNMNVPTQNKQ
jgi:hypothetical protein